MATDDAVGRVDARQRHDEQLIGRWSRRLAAAVAIVAFIGVVLPTPWGSVVAAVAVVGVIVTPVGRVCWLIVVWRRQRDWRFVGVGVVLVCVMAAGVVVAALRGG
jgi:hypothetical protein